MPNVILEPATIVAPSFAETMAVLRGAGRVSADSNVSALTGLDFPGNVDFPSASPSIIFAWNSTILGGQAPFGAYPATYIWRAYPREQNPGESQSFWTFMFNARWQTDTFDQYTTEYYGCHPYPDFFDNAIVKWEISIQGGDQYLDEVVFDQWYTQVVIAWESAGDENVRYYWNWPNTTTDIIEFNGETGYPPPSDPAIIVGDAPWNAGFENPNAILRGFQYYDGIAMNESQIAASIADPYAVQTPWYLKMNPTPTDIADESGGGHDPVWYGANRPGLWQG